MRLRPLSRSNPPTRAFEVFIMVQCPFCHYNNEDGALFCEQCKSDLAGVAVVEASRRRRPRPSRWQAEPVSAEAMPVEAMPDGSRCRCRRSDADGSRSPCRQAMPMEADCPSRPCRSKRLPFAFEARRSKPSRRRRCRRPRRLPPPPPARRPPPPLPRAVRLRLPPPPPRPAPAVRLRPRPPSGRTSRRQGAKLVVLRGNKRNAEYPIYEGQNFVGRADEKPVDIDLEDQEPPDRVWSSRQHACIFFENGELSIEDLNSSNGTFVNRARIYPGQKKRSASTTWSRSAPSS